MLREWGDHTKKLRATCHGSGGITQKTFMMEVGKMQGLRSM